MTDSPTSADVPTKREILPWEIRIPRSAIVEHPMPGSQTSPDCAVILDDEGGLWLREPAGQTALIVIRGDRVRVVDDSATDLAQSADAELERALDELGGRAGHATWCQASGLAIDEECNCGHDNECDAKSIVRVLFASQTTERDHWKDVADSFIRIGVNRGPLRGGVEFYINEEWRIALENHLCSASLYTTKFDPDDEPVRVRPIADDDALLLDASRTLTPEEAAFLLRQPIYAAESLVAKLRRISEGK